MQSDDECQYCDGQRDRAQPCVWPTLCLPRAQPAAVCCPVPSCCSAHSTLVTGLTRISGPERERERWADDLNISQQSRGRSSPVLRERARHNKKASSLFLYPRNFQFSFSLSLKTSLLPPFLLLSQHTTHNKFFYQQGGGKRDRRRRVCKILYRIKPQRRLN